MRNLVATNEIAVAQIEGTWTAPDTLTTTRYLDGWTTGLSNYIRIYTATEARHGGKWDDTKYVLKNNGGGLSILEDYVFIDGLQVDAITTNGITVSASTAALSEIRISNSIIRGGSTNNGIHYSGKGVLKAWNNLTYGLNHGKLTICTKQNLILFY